MPDTFARPDLTAFAEEKLTVSTSAVGPTAATIAATATRPAAYAAVVSLAATNGVSYTVDGTTPTSTVGILAAGGTEFVVEGVHNVANLQMIRSGGSDATANLTYYYE